MKLVYGTSLFGLDVDYVLRAYVHRFTGDHKPEWAGKEWKDGKPYPLQFRDDNDWLANTKFAVRLDGSLDGRVKYCESHPTWPDNPELRQS